MTAQIPPVLLEMAELGIEHREAADIDCREERLLLDAVRGTALKCHTAEEVRARKPGVELLVGYFSDPNRAWRCKDQWSRDGFRSCTRRVGGSYCVYARALG